MMYNDYLTSFSISDVGDWQSSTLETDVYVWCYALVVLHARKEEEEVTIRPML